MKRLEQLLVEHRSEFCPIVPVEFQGAPVLVLDFEGDTQGWHEVDVFSLEALIQHTDKLLQASGAKLVVGRYNEDRAALYRRSPLFQSAETQQWRTIHLGIDLSLPVATPIFAPLTGTVYSFQNNEQAGDYGPTVILQHELGGVVFYTLYGHLSLESLREKIVEKKYNAGEQIGSIGNSEVNGGWPPHVHFQVIREFGEHKAGDFPGVIDAERREQYLEHCVDPNLILQLRLDK